MNNCKDCKEKISNKAIRCKSCSNKFRKGKFGWNNLSKNKIKEKGNSMWKGNKVRMSALHEWVKKRKIKSNLCENCHEYPPYDLANISGKYKRDLNDWEWLCRKCHMEKDGRLEKFKGIWKKTLKNIVCSNCHKKFKQRSIRQKYCSKKCYYKIKYQRNREKILKKSRDYYQKNKEKINKRDRINYRKNKLNKLESN